jgi:hypothetical protein
MKLISTTIIALCLALTASAQTDTTLQHWDISLSTGISQPFNNYASLKGNGAGFAKLGASNNLRVNYFATTNWSFWVNYDVSTSAVNTKKNSEESVKNMQKQISNFSSTSTIQNANIVASRWIIQNITAGVAYNSKLGKKLLATYYLGAGTAIVRNPRIINTMYVNDLVFETRSKAANNASFVINGGAKIAYKVQERTSLYIGAEFYNVFASGVFETTTLGNNRFMIENVKYQQTLQMLNVNFGISTHF